MGEAHLKRKGEHEKENNSLAVNRTRELLIDQVHLKDYLSNIVRKVDDCEKETGLARKFGTINLCTEEAPAANILDALNETPVLTSMRSEGGLLKIKRKRSTLRIFNPYA